MKAKIFVKEEKVEVTLHVISETENGGIRSISTTSYSDEVLKASKFQQDSLSFVFSVPNYEDMNKYRQLSMYYDSLAGQAVINPLRLRELLLMYHLKDWSLKNEEDEPIVLGFDPDGSLDRKTLSILKETNHQVIDVLMTNYELKINLD